MDDRVLPDARRASGAVFQMQLELFENRPELEGERLVMDVDNMLLPLYYDATRINSDAAIISCGAN